jgi:ABC-2 type transport system ATP-binding protein
VIRVEALTKQYGGRTAVDALTFTAGPGVVTGFLGPNGAGKSTTMRMIMGLDAPTSGSVTVNGTSYADHRAPLHEVGALLEARAVHTGRSARDHLRVLAATHGLGKRRVDEVIDMVGLGAAADRRVGSFSLGMGQRLGLGAALLGDPQTLILDEPVNGLDLDGIRWIRALLRDLAGQGRTVLLSSHLMGEMAMTADRIVLIGRGRLLRETSTADFIAEASTGLVRVRSPQPRDLAALLARQGAHVRPADDRDGQDVEGLSSEQIGSAAAAAGITLFELTPVTASLEQAYLSLTQDAGEYPVAPPTPVGAERGAAA